VIVSDVSGRLQIATLDWGKGDKPYKIMMARFILQEIVAFQMFALLTVAVLLLGLNPEGEK
jgi:hypothetical protein